VPLVIPTFTPSTRESHEFDGIELADGIIFDLADAPVFTPAPLRLDWIGGIDADGSVPLDTGHSDNATLTLPLRVQKQTSADNAWNKLGVIVAKLEATRRSRDGLQHVWTPKDATSSWLLTVRSGEIAELPMASRGDAIGYLLRAPRFTIVLTCDPFLYRDGELVEYDEVTSSAPVFSMLLDNVPGHVDAEATITVTDDAGEARRHVEVGLGENSAAPLLVDSAAGGLKVTGFAGARTTRTGSYGSDVIRATLATQTQAICGTGELGHVGVMRPKARIWATSLNIRLRLAYRTADGSYSYTPWVAPVVEDAFCEVAFGVITVGVVRAGAQQWDARIEAYSETAGDTVDVDYLEPLPSERWMAARAAYQYHSGVLTALDGFTGRTAGAALGGTAAQIGGNWTTTGATTDFAAADDYPASGEESIARATVDSSARLAVIGGSVTDCEASITAGIDGATSLSEDVEQGVVARYANTSNYVRATFEPNGFGSRLFQVIVRIAGAETVVASHDYGQFGAGRDIDGTTRLIVRSDGTFIATRFLSSSEQSHELLGEHSSLSTGGVLESGKAGIYDRDGGGNGTRHYRDFYAATPPAEPIAIYPDRAIEFRHDSTERESADGSLWGKPKLTPGGRALVPCAGSEGRAYRLWCKARRNDIATVADAHIADATKLKVSLRPRYRMPTSP